MTTEWQDEQAATALRFTEVSRTTLLGELNGSTNASTAGMWDECDEITTYVLAKKSGETVTCEFHTIKKGKPGVVSGRSGPDNLLVLSDVDEEIRAVTPRPDYLATEEDLRPPVIE